MYKSTIIILMGVACFCVSVLGEKGTSGKSISSAVGRASELSFVFFFGMFAVHLESMWLGIVGVVLIVYYAHAASGITCSAKASGVSSGVCFTTMPRRTLRSKTGTRTSGFGLWALPSS